MRAILRNCLRNKGGRRFSGFLRGTRIFPVPILRNVLFHTTKSIIQHHGTIILRKPSLHVDSLKHKLRYARKDNIKDIAPPLSHLIFKSTDVESLGETPAKNGATTGEGRASVGLRARCGPFPAHPCALSTPEYAYVKLCCLAHVSVEVFVLTFAVI